MMLLGNHTIIDAPKHKWGVEEIDNNACARVFPPPVSIMQAIARLEHIPKYGPDVRKEKKVTRIMKCQRIPTGVWPNSHTVQIYESISRILPSPYFGRDINDPNFQRWAKQMAKKIEKTTKGKVTSDEIEEELKLEGVTMPAIYPKSMLICGPPGMGKTTIIQRILATFYPNRGFSHIANNGDVYFQIPYLYINCSHLNSAVALVRAIIKQIAFLAGYQPQHLCSMVNTGTFENLLPEMAMLIAFFSVGTIFIDEAEQISSKASGGKVALADVWVRMINECGTSLVLIANPDISKGLGPQLRMRLRLCGMGAIRCDRLAKDSDDWKVLGNKITEVQFTKNPTDITQEILDMLHEKSQGLIKPALLLWEFTNELAITESPGERITPELVAQAYRRNASTLHEIIHGIKNCNTKAEDVDCGWMENDGWIDGTSKSEDGSSEGVGADEEHADPEENLDDSQLPTEKPEKSKPRKFVQERRKPKIVDFVRCAADKEYQNGRTPHRAISDLGFIGLEDEFA